MNGRQVVTALAAIFLLPFFVSAASLTSSPSNCSGDWQYCSNAFGDDDAISIAAVTDSVNATSTWSSYGFSIPSNATITGVTIRTDARSTVTNGRITLQVSTNGGASFNGSYVLALTGTEQTYLTNVTGLFSWTPAMLNNNSIVVRATAWKYDIGGNPTVVLDYLPVTVTYS